MRDFESIRECFPPDNHMTVSLKCRSLPVQSVSVVEPEKIECRERRGSALFRAVLVFGRYVNFSESTSHE